jgi:hypothetical protein
MASGKPEIEDYLAPSPRHVVWNKEGVRSAIVIPVLAGDKALGPRPGRRVPHKTTPEEVSLLQAAGNRNRGSRRPMPMKRSNSLSASSAGEIDQPSPHPGVVEISTSRCKDRDALAVCQRQTVRLLPRRPGN